MLIYKYMLILPIKLSKTNCQRGYVALASVLVIAAVVLSIGTSVALLSVNEVTSSLASKKSDESLDAVEGCADDALLRLNETGSIPSSLVLPEVTCSVTINSQSGDDWDFTVTGEVGGFTKVVRVAATRSSNVTVTSWLEQ